MRRLIIWISPEAVENLTMDELTSQLVLQQGFVDSKKLTVNSTRGTMRVTISQASVESGFYSAKQLTPERILVVVLRASPTYTNLAIETTAIAQAIYGMAGPPIDL